MKKEEIIRRYGEDAYAKKLEQERARHKANKEEANARSKKWQEEHPGEAKAYNKKYKEEHPEVIIANDQEQNRKGGRRYDKKLEYNQTGIQGDRNKIRAKHRTQYRPYKQIIAPGSQLHHEWIPRTAEYRGVALVEADQHMHGIVDVIEILDGKIAVLTEEEVKRKQVKKSS